MKTRKKLLLTLFVLLMCNVFHANSQEVWSLEKCIMHARKNNLQVKLQEYNLELQKTTLNQAQSKVLPNLNAGAGQTFTFGRAVDRYTNNFFNQSTSSSNFYLSSSVSLFKGLQNYNSIQQEKFNLQASLMDVEKTKNDISLSIAANYLQILFNQELLKIAEQQLDISNQQVGRTQKMVSAGKLAQGDLLDIQAQQAQDALAVVNAKNTLEVSQLNLAQFLMLENANNFKIETPNIDVKDSATLLPTIDVIYAEALKNLPEVKSAEMRLQSSQKALLYAKGYASPSLTLQANYSSGYSSVRKNYEVVGNMTIEKDYLFFDQLRDNASKSIGFNLNIPIFNNFQVRDAVSSAKINIIKSQTNIDITKNQIYKDIQQAHVNASASLQKYFASQKASASTTEAFKYAQQKYDLGLISSMDYNNTKAKLTKTQSDLLQAKYDYVFRLKILDFYRGIQVELK